MAEAHPVGFRWVMKARERGATIIHVDPRFSRTSALADIWVPIRAGSDIAFLGGIIRHLIKNDLFFREYVVHYTNASCILSDEYRDPEDNGDGYFSGWNEERRAYEGNSWLYKGGDLSRPLRDPTLQDPQCVFQKLRRHFSRYTLEIVEKICGIPPELFHKVANALVAASGPERTAAICYAVGWTQHSKGVQIIRAAAILQLLLGNIGRPGGGILALRGHASIQGSTDIPTLYDILPGYLAMPRKGDETLQQYLENYTKKTGLWADYPKYLVSTLKAYYGKHATAENDFGYCWLPKLTANHSFFEYLYDMLDGKMEGMFLMGQNPAVGAPNARLQRKALSKLKWLVVREMVEIESANFWRESPEVERGELKAEEIDIEIDVPDLDQQLAQAHSQAVLAQKSLELAKSTNDKWQQLWHQGVVSELDAEDKSTSQATNQANTEAFAANLRFLQQEVAFQKVTAPFAGTITVRNVNVGDLITANNTNFEMFHIQQMNPLRVYFRIPQPEAPNIEVGQTFNVQVGAQSAKTYPGKVISTSEAVSPDSRTMLVQLQVDNSKNEILPGSYATARVPANVLGKVLTLPDNTLIFRGKSLQVGVVDANGVVQVRDVKVGRDFGVQNEILSGVSESDRVIVNPSDSLITGTTVRVGATPAASPSPAVAKK